MGTHNEESGKQRHKRSAVNRLLRLLSVVGLIAAIVKELRTPADVRTWEGTLIGFVPYDLRRPTMDRFKERLWNRDGPLVSPQVFGVGWTVNFGALVSRLRPGG